MKGESDLSLMFSEFPDTDRSLKSLVSSPESSGQYLCATQTGEEEGPCLIKRGRASSLTSVGLRVRVRESRPAVC